MSASTPRGASRWTPPSSSPARPARRADSLPRRLRMDATSPTRRILGLDPGLQVTGYGVLDHTPAGPRHREAGVLRSAVDGRATSDMAQRVKVLYDGLVEVLAEWAPTVMVVEQLYAHYDHPRTAILMAHTRG